LQKKKKDGAMHIDAPDLQFHFPVPVTQEIKPLSFFFDLLATNPEVRFVDLASSPDRRDGWPAEQGMSRQQQYKNIHNGFDLVLRKNIVAQN
jgi:hypothetical protein